MSQTELAATVQELQTLKRDREALDARIEALTDSIKSHMGSTEQLIAGAFKITWKAVTSTRFDASAFKRDFSDVYNRYTVPTTVRRFTVQ